MFESCCQRSRARAGGGYYSQPPSLPRCSRWDSREEEERCWCPRRINHPTTDVSQVHGVLAELIQSEIKELRKDIADHHTSSIERLESFFREELRQQCSGLRRSEKFARLPKLSTHKVRFCSEGEMSPVKDKVRFCAEGEMSPAKVRKMDIDTEVHSIPRAPSTSIPDPVVETRRDSTRNRAQLCLKRLKTKASTAEAEDFQWMENMVLRIGNTIGKRIEDDALLCGLDKRHCGQTPKTVMAKIANSDAFAFFFGAVVLLNAMFIGARVQYGMILYREDPREPYPEWILYIEQMFNAIFIFEMTFRILAIRQVFFFGDQSRWNIFELTLVILAFTETSTNYTFGRLFRCLRVARVIRVVRLMPGLTSLRIMICSMVHSLPALLWAGVLLIVILYFFSLIFTAAVLDYLQQNDQIEVSIKDELLESYGGLIQTMFTLFLAITGGNDWCEMQHVLSHISNVYCVVFVLYIFWMIFGIFNILVGVFVDSAFESSSLDADLIVQREESKMDKFMKEILSIFEEFDPEGAGTIDRQTFMSSLDDKRMKTYMQSNQLDLMDPERFFQVLDTNNSGEISESELILGMMKLTGQARSADLVTLLTETRRIHSKLGNSTKNMERQLQHLVAICGRPDRTPFEELSE